MSWFQLKLSDLLSKVDEDISTRVYFGWDGNDTLMKFRHLYLKILLEDQLKHFDRS